MNTRLAGHSRNLKSQIDNHIGSEGLEPSPHRLKGEYAAVTPRPWQIATQRLWRNKRAMTVPRLRVVRGGIAPATGGLSDRNAPLTTPDQRHKTKRASGCHAFAAQPVLGASVERLRAAKACHPQRFYASLTYGPSAGREALESSYAGFQAAATPSQLPTHWRVSGGGRTHAYRVCSPAPYQLGHGDSRGLFLVASSRRTQA